MFLGQDYLIGNETGKRIFESVKGLPILDPHNHADVAAIARNENFKDAWELFAATDHYVWEVLRKAGVSEEKITGTASPHDKFIAMANVFDRIAGNPVYEWIHLDLRFLGVTELLNAETGETVWQKVNEIIAKEESRPQALLKRMNVGVMCSTDDPADTLEDHRTVNESFGRTVVRPTWRPDMAMKAGKPGFPPTSNASGNAGASGSPRLANCWTSFGNPTISSPKTAAAPAITAWKSHPAESAMRPPPRKHSAKPSQGNP